MFLRVHRAVLRTDMMRLLQRLGDSLSSRKDKTVFQINNINQILYILREVYLASIASVRFNMLSVGVCCHFVCAASFAAR